ncbi:TatD family hydrolase [Thermogymnomonas acidicola]|uniref:TatD family hydrolase n=1 Tax=Thermogymnomonas acidicola TaxID=399579 RepID=UPI001396B393|nr:TatD family hydrolase [Thermogymnomonas acidicola]
MVTLGPYPPLDLLMFSGAGRDPEMEVMRGAELAIKLYSEGLCSCIGEVGLPPHFRVSDEHMDLSWKLLGQILSMAADEGAPVMLHTMDLGADGYRRIEGLTVSAGMDRRRVVKHHALPQDLLLGTEIRISLLATRPNIRHWISVRKPAFLETDYVDDPSKPGKVIPPDSVPKRVRMAEQECEDCEELLHSAFHDLPPRRSTRLTSASEGRLLMA